MKLKTPFSGMIAIFLLMLCMVVASSCKKLPIQSSTVVTDSTFVTEVIRIDSIVIPGDSIPFEVFIECDSITNKPKPLLFSTKSGRAFIEIRLDSAGMLEGICKADSLLKVVESQNQIITRLRFEKKTVVIPCPEKKSGWFRNRVNTIVFGALLIIIITLILLRFLKL